MEATFKILETSRNIYLKFLEGYTLEQLNKIPEGFSNNLIWNIGHIVVSQQGLIYRLSGLPVNVSDEMTEKYKNGSCPDGKATQEEVDTAFNRLANAMWKLEFYKGNKAQLQAFDFVCFIS